MTTADFIAEIEAMHDSAIEMHDSCKRVDLFTEAVIWTAKADTLALVLDAARRLLPRLDSVEYAELAHRPTLRPAYAARRYDRRMQRAEHDS